ncbi:KEOPS complex subunit Pcc1 [Salinigranum marinum]|uniref:KEOPS complex subunit Pcc1 n=1 Tax=Salinigranum marinum TaxID=1515595 RepID=UPI002989EC11|nr:KEOPS complex subunit Pcc1 [Salinigranum marinum]
MRRAALRTTHASPEAAAVVAGAVEPDNTDSMTTRVDGDAVVTTIEREATGGLHSSVDDYVVNLTVADRLVDAGRPAAGRDDATAADDADGTTADTPIDRTEPTDDQTDTTHDTHE